MFKQFRRRKFIFRAVIWLLFSTIVTPIIYAFVLGFVYHDWRIMTAMLDDPMAPVIQMWNYASNPVVQRAFATAFVVALLLSGVFFLVAFRKKKSPLGEAAFQTRDDLKAGGWFRMTVISLADFGRTFCALRMIGITSSLPHHGLVKVSAM